MNSRERFLAACRRQSHDRPPAWLMRQAGRYLPEYRAIRSNHGFLEMLEEPELAEEITCQPLRRFDMDAAVVFADILVPCGAMGQKVEFIEGKGPVLSPALRTEADIDALEDFDADQATGYVAETIRRTRQTLGEDKAIIGFCGAPWTTASYMIEGESSRDFRNTKLLMYEHPAVFERLLERLVDNLIGYLKLQIEAGADVVQIFDSWGGALDAETYRRVLSPHLRRLVQSVKAEAPVILYLNGCGHLLEVLADTEPDVISIDWRVNPADAIARIGQRVALQGNLDPCALLAPGAVEAEVRRVLAGFRDQHGYIFNLGSGILPKTPIESVETLFRTLRGQPALH